MSKIFIRTLLLNRAQHKFVTIILKIFVYFRDICKATLRRQVKTENRGFEDGTVKFLNKNKQ